MSTEQPKWKNTINIKPQHVWTDAELAKIRRFAPPPLHDCFICGRTLYHMNEFKSLRGRIICHECRHVEHRDEDIGEIS